MLVPSTMMESRSRVVERATIGTRTSAWCKELRGTWPRVRRQDGILGLAPSRHHPRRAPRAEADTSRSDRNCAAEARSTSEIQTAPCRLQGKSTRAIEGRRAQPQQLRMHRGWARGPSTLNYVYVHRRLRPCESKASLRRMTYGATRWTRGEERMRRRRLQSRASHCRGAIRDPLHSYGLKVNRMCGGDKST